MSGVEYPYLALSALVVALIALLRALFDHRTLRDSLSGFELRAREAERMLKERGALASELAHEIKNPITAILCSAEALDLLVGKSLDENHRKCLLYMKEYGDNLLRLMSDFLDLSRLEAGHLECHPERIIIADLIDSIVGLLQPSAQAKSITLKAFVMDRKVCVWADPRQVKQVLFNLVHNAIKFTEDAGEIQVLIRSNFPHHTASISVRDNGCGITDEVLPTIFDPYVRDAGSSSRTSREEGFGLGLAVCKALVELQGGVLSVTSQYGVGSCFDFTLPLHDPQDVKSEELVAVAEIQETRPLEGRRVLLVDQNDGARQAMAQLIEAWGAMVDQVTEAKDAMTALHDHHYDAVLVDETKDGLSAPEAAQKVSQDLAKEQTAVIVAARDDAEQMYAKELGVENCVEKPLNGKVLLDSLLRNFKVH